jgi:predicted nucleotidyltransferase
MTQKERQSIIKQVVGEIVALANPAKVLLFGSSSGKRSPQTSDLDFLVVIANQENPDKVLDQLNLGVKTRILPCDFVVATERTLQALGQKDGLVYREALSSGKIVYAACPFHSSLPH